LPHYLVGLLLLPPHDSLVFPIPPSSTLLLAAVMCATHLLLSQCFLNNLIYCPAFLGAIHCTNYWRPAESSLSSIFFCRLLWPFHYSRLILLPTISGHVAKLPTMIAHSISSFSSVHVHCIWVSLWTRLISPSVECISSSSPIPSCLRNSCPPGYLPPSSSIRSSSKASPWLRISPWARRIPPQYPFFRSTLPLVPI